MGVEGGDGEGEDEVSAIRADAVRDTHLCRAYVVPNLDY